MTSVKRITLIAFSVGLLASLEAKMVDQTISLAQGWNAFYLEVTPESNSCDEVFADLPVSKVGAYVPDAESATRQYNNDGSRIVAPPVSYLVWNSTNSEDYVEGGSTLKSMTGGAAYICFAAEKCTLNVRGVPELPQDPVLRNTVDAGGIMNLVGVSIDADAEVTAHDYFADSPVNNQTSVYRPAGTIPDAPRFLPYAMQRCKLKGGSAVMVHSTADAEWQGVIRVVNSSATGLSFDENSKIGRFTVENVSSTSCTVRVSLQRSARETDRMPVVKYLRKEGFFEVGEWKEFDAPLERVLAPRESWDVSLSADADQPSGACVVRVETVGHPSKLRFLMPLEVTREAAAGTPEAYPAGLWAGALEMKQVGFGTNAGTNRAAGVMKPFVLVHVDGEGRARLLQRVTLAWDSENADADLRAKTHLYSRMSDVPAGFAKRRLSSLVLDTLHPAVAAASSNASNRPARFGEELTFEYVIGERSKENPFRHAHHPDHDGKSPDFKGLAPSGDDARNFLGKIKPESFSVTNRISLVWRDVNDESTFERTPEEGTYGRVEWSLGGLRADGAVKMRGVFILKRIAANPVLNMNGSEN